MSLRLIQKDQAEWSDVWDADVWPTTGISADDIRLLEKVCGVFDQHPMPDTDAGQVKDLIERICDMAKTYSNQRREIAAMRPVYDAALEVASAHRRGETAMSKMLVVAGGQIGNHTNALARAELVKRGLWK